MVILDTCAIIELFKPEPTFTKKTETLIYKGCYILSVSFAEIACKVQIGKLGMSVSTRELWQQFKNIEHTHIIDITVEEWLHSIELIWEDNKDPADRLITAFALRHELPIVTTDKKIKNYYKKVIW